MNTLPSRDGCSACGTSPVNHRLARISNFFEALGSKIVGTLHPLLYFRSENMVVNYINAFLSGGLVLAHIARFSDDVSKAASGRSELIWHEATRRGIKMQQLKLLDKYLEQYRAKIEGRWYYFQSIPVPPWVSQSGYIWLDDKLALAHHLEKAGIPVPRARLATTRADAHKAFTELSKPVIIKPRFGSRGRHTTTNINTIEELETAFALAKEIAQELVVEEHLEGSVCRATTVGGKLVGFFEARPPHVVGDGSHTIAELIAETNAKRPERLGEVVVNSDVVSYIARRGYTLESVVPCDELLALSAKTGRFYGGYTREMIGDVHPAFHTIFEKLSTLIEAPVMGFDLINPDPTKDPSTVRWGIIECNSLPFIDLHYYALEGTPNDLAPKIWDLWKK